MYEPTGSLASEVNDLLNTDTKLALGSLAIINGFVYLGDLALGVIDLKRED